MRVEVKQTHINDGLPGNGCLCPIALAIREMFGIDNFGNAVHVGGILVRVALEDPNKHYWLTEKAIRFVNRFDQRKKVKPTTFVFKEYQQP